MAERAVSFARRLASELLAIGAVSLSPSAPFTWASGLRAPVYCDNRLTLAYPALREAIAEGFAGILAAQDLRAEVILGTATAGIPHAAWLAQRLGLPMAYVRSRPKAHGRGNQVEGRLARGQRAVVVEDLISTGLSSLAAVEAVQAAGAEVRAVLAIFTYGLPVAAEAFARAGVPVYTLTNFDVLLDVAREQGLLGDGASGVLQAWRRDPQAWSAAREGAG